MSWNALKWHGRGQIAKLGALGAVGVALAVFAAAFQLSAVSALDTELVGLRAEGERLNMRHQPESKQPANARRGPGAQLDTFYEFFPARATLPDWLLRIYGAAEQQGVVLELCEYKLVQEKGSRLVRYQITLPVKGSYEQIRGFIAAVLNEVPAAVIDDIGLKREAIGARNLEARLKLTLFLRLENR
jgi:Tfp pilus assembly protein PilO